MKNGENSKIIGGGRRSDAAGRGDFWVYAAMDLRGPAPGRCVRLPDCGAEFPEPEKQGIVRV